MNKNKIIIKTIVGIFIVALFIGIVPIVNATNYQAMASPNPQNNSVPIGQSQIITFTAQNTSPDACPSNDQVWLPFSGSSGSFQEVIGLHSYCSSAQTRLDTDIYGCAAVSTSDGLIHNYKATIDWITHTGNLYFDNVLVSSNCNFSSTGINAITNINVWCEIASFSCASDNHGIIALNNLVYTTPYSGLTPTATSTTYTSITASDISLYGDFVLLRTLESGVSNIRTFDGKTASSYAFIPTNCNIVGGLTNIANQGLAFTACTAGDHSHPYSIKVANYFNGQFPYGHCEAYACGSSYTNCPTSVCNGEFVLPSSIQAKNLVHLEALNGAITATDSSRAQQFYGFNFLYDETNGKVDNIANSYFIYGLDNEPTTVGNRVCITKASDGSRPANCVFTSESELTDGTQAMDQMCSYNNFKGYTVSQNANGQEYTSATTLSYTDPSYVSTLTNSFHEPFDNSISVDCGSVYNIGTKTTSVTVLNQNSHVQRWTKTLVAGRYGTINGNGTWAAYSDGGKTYIVNGEDGSQVAYITNPGTLINLQMDDLAQRLYLFTSTNFYIYDIHTNTTGTVVLPGDATGCLINCNDNGEHTSSSTGGTINQIVNTNTVSLNTGDNILGINIPYTAAGLNISRTAVLLLISVVLMGVFAIWIYRNTESIIGLVIGAFLGLILSVAMSLIPEWAIILVALLLLILFGKMLFGGFYGGGEE